MRPSVTSSSPLLFALAVCILASTVTSRAVPPGSPGYRVGQTKWDQQHPGSVGRQVDWGPGTWRQVVWCGEGEYTQSEVDIVWNKMTPAGSPHPITLDNGSVVDVLMLGGYGPPSPGLVLGTQPCYPNFRTIPSGRGVTASHDGDVLLTSVDHGIAVGICDQDTVPAPAGPDSVLYAKLATDVVGSDTVLHVIGTEPDPGSSQRVYYWRGTLVGVDVTWAAPVVIDSVQTLSATIEASPASDDVAIVYTHPREGAADIYDNDVAYRLSTDGGLTWGPAFTLFSAVGRDQAFADVGTVFDYDNTLHVIFNTVYRDPALGVPFGPCNLYHWNSARGFTRPVASAAWWNTCSEVDSLRGGLWDLRLNKPNLIVKPAGAGPGSGIADELIYAVWVQFGPTETDCATQNSAGTPGGYVNGEVWCSVSSDDGLTWDWPQNITGTETPDCLPGDCRSEQWVSAAAYADSGVYLSYVLDTHAGAAVVGEGELTTSVYMLYAPATREPAATPRIRVSPDRVPYPRCIGGDEYFVDLKIVTESDSTFEVSVGNLGNSTLDYEVIVQPDGGGTPHVLVNGGLTHGGSVPTAVDDEVFSVQCDVAGLAVGSNHLWRVSVASNDPVYDTIDLHLNVTVADSLVTISGAKFHDRNANGVWERGAGEETVPGWTIRAEPGGHAAVTDDSGWYSLQGLLAGTYTVSEDPMWNWTQTYPGTPATHTITLAEGQDTTANDFGNLYCPIDIPGDANSTGFVTSADVIYLVNYVFKGSTEPLPCEANGDVNCSGSVSAADIIDLVRYVFKGGNVPCDICAHSPMECLP